MAGGPGSHAGSRERVNTVDFRPLGLAVGHASDAEGGTGVTVVGHAQTEWREAQVPQQPYVYQTKSQ